LYFQILLDFLALFEILLLQFYFHLFVLLKLVIERAANINLHFKLFWHLLQQLCLLHQDPLFQGILLKMHLGLFLLSILHFLLILHASIFLLLTLNYIIHHLYRSSLILGLMHFQFVLFVKVHFMFQLFLLKELIWFQMFVELMAPVTVLL